MTTQQIRGVTHNLALILASNKSIPDLEKGYVIGNDGYVEFDVNDRTVSITNLNPTRYESDMPKFVREHRREGVAFVPLGRTAYESVTSLLGNEGYPIMDGVNLFLQHKITLPIEDVVEEPYNENQRREMDEMMFGLLIETSHLTFSKIMERIRSSDKPPGSDGEIKKYIIDRVGDETLTEDGELDDEVLYTI